MTAISLQALYQGLLVGTAGLFFYTRCVALLGPARATLFIPLVPLVAAIAGALLLGEQPSFQEITGMVVAISGMLVALRRS